MTDAFNNKELRDWLISHLKLGPMKIKFLKVDGTERTMNCTLSKEILGKILPAKDKIAEGTKGKRERIKNDEILSVFDLDKNDWRSFRLDSITVVSFEL